MLLICCYVSDLNRISLFHLCAFFYLIYVHFYLIYMDHTVSLHTLVIVLAPQYVSGRPGMCGNLRLSGGAYAENSHADGTLEGG